MTMETEQTPHQTDNLIALLEGGEDLAVAGRQRLGRWCAVLGGQLQHGLADQLLPSFDLFQEFSRARQIDVQYMAGAAEPSDSPIIRSVDDYLNTQVDPEFLEAFRDTSESSRESVF
ncbi:hypothetical protein [Streptomyces sp. NPDC056165]|uniref:hypothetical protein n=1 Tax=Streptomyces sp. NPDC056165 TaxID=3345733 RepID=UPI0035D811B7